MAHGYENGADRGNQHLLAARALQTLLDVLNGFDARYGSNNATNTSSWDALELHLDYEFDDKAVIDSNTGINDPDKRHGKFRGSTEAMPDPDEDELEDEVDNDIPDDGNDGVHDEIVPDVDDLEELTESPEILIGAPELDVDQRGQVFDVSADGPITMKVTVDGENIIIPSAGTYTLNHEKFTEINVVAAADGYTIKIQRNSVEVSEEESYPVSLEVGYNLDGTVTTDTYDTQVKLKESVEDVEDINKPTVDWTDLSFDSMTEHVIGTVGNVDNMTGINIDGNPIDMTNIAGGGRIESTAIVLTNGKVWIDASNQIHYLPTAEVDQPVDLEIGYEDVNGDPQVLNETENVTYETGDTDVEEDEVYNGPETMDVRYYIAETFNETQIDKIDYMGDGTYTINGYEGIVIVENSSEEGEPDAQNDSTTIRNFTVQQGTVTK